MAGEYKSREEKRRAKQAKQKPKRKAGLFVKRTILTLFILGIIGMIAGGSLFAYYASSSPPLDEKLLKDPIASEILDMNGNVITTVGEENREYVSYDKIPKLVEDAVLATEDNRFYKHNGIDIIRLGGAVIANVTNGFGSEGASTITQQVVKRSFLNPEKKLKRKAQEAWLAVQLEQEKSKEEIFEMYVNKIYYDDGINGIATAANHYYGKDLHELELHEAAMLAGIPQLPSRFNPFEHPEAAEKRRNTVLSLMNQHGKITAEEMEAAKKISVSSTLVSEEQRQSSKSTMMKYPAFVDVVIDEVAELGDYNLFSDGLKIYTTLDPNAQKRVEQILNGEAIDFAYPERYEEIMQAGITVMDTKTGEIRAIGGGRNQTDVQRGFNYATDIERQPGSTIKPLLDYAPAIEYLQWSTYHIIEDKPYEKDGWKPANWDNQFKGAITAREALWDSRNIPAIKAFVEVGPERAEEFVNGIGLDFDHYYESAAIGGVTPGVNTVDMAAAYAPFGNKGLYNKPHTVKKIVLRDGETEVKQKIEPKTVMKDYTAYMITDMLKSVIDHPRGTGIYAKVPGLSMAGKSGTTNYEQKERDQYGLKKSDAPDSWFVGYTTNYTTAVWTGYEQRKYGLTPSDRHIAQYIVADIMGYLSESVETADFEKPGSVVESQVELGSNPARLPSDFTPEDRIITELFVKGTEPTKVSEEFDKMESPKNLEAKYDKDNQTVTLTWEHDADEGNDENIEFEISGSYNDQPSKVITKTKDKGININDIRPGAKYIFEVVAISGDQRSEAASVTLDIQADEPDTDDETDENSDENENGDEENNEDGNNSGDEDDQSEDNNEDTNNNEGQNNGGTGNTDTETPPSDGGNTGTGNGNGNTGQNPTNTN